MRVAFSTTGQPFSKLIRSAEHWDSSHVSFGYDDRWMLHASIGGVQPGFWELFAKTHKVTHLILIEDAASLAVDAAIERHLGDYIGRPYDYPSLFGFLLDKVLQFFRLRPKKNLLDTENAYVCVEFVNRVLLDAGIGYYMPKHISLMGLHETYTNILAHKWAKEIPLSLQ